MQQKFSNFYFSYCLDMTYKPTASEVKKVSQFFSRSNRTLVISGAGVSTESGIPDYRSPQGSYSKGHKPVTHQEFIFSEAVRKRYWARSVLGIKYFAHREPNRVHKSLTKLQQMNFVSNIITQNVDRLHQKSGSVNVLELHGHAGGVKCLNCSKEYSRIKYTNDLEASNATFVHFVRSLYKDIDQRADGDAAIDEKVVDFSQFKVEPCPNCGGTLMPTIVFFGGSIDEKVKLQAADLVTTSEQVIILGSTVQTYSAFRLLRLAQEQQKEIGIINLGETRADSIASWKVTCSIGDILEQTLLQLSSNELSQI